MRLRSVSLTNFRNYPKTQLAFGEQTLIVGENGVGKSNILEAIYLLATGKSFRADRDFEMVKYGEQFATVAGPLDDDTDLTVAITDRKKFEVNGVPKRMIDFVGRVKATLFAPSDMELMTGSPGGRRRYLDFIITQADREYRRSLISYEKGLRQRNKLLEMIRENLATRSQLFFWDRLLIREGDYLTRRRQEYLTRLNNEKYTSEYDKSVISESRLAQYEMEEVAAATTLVGPHRDDFRLLHNDRDISKYGSRGEQRMAVLWLKNTEVNYLSEGSLPLLLLDDIMSELDSRHQEEVMQVVAQHNLAGGQTVMTSADFHLVHSESGATIIRL